MKTQFSAGQCRATWFPAAVSLHIFNPSWKADIVRAGGRRRFNSFTAHHQYPVNLGEREVHMPRNILDATKRVN